MLKRLIAPAAAAFAVLLLVGTVETAEAKRGGGGYSGGGGYARHSGGGYARSFTNKSYVARSYGGSRIYSNRIGKTYRYAGHYGHRRHIHRRVFVGVPLAYGYYGYSDSCYWLRRRAEDSGSGYWWNRYYACVDGYDPY